MQSEWGQAMSNKKGWLLILGGMLILIFAYVGYHHRQYSQLAKALHDPDPVVRMDLVRKAGRVDQGDLLIEALHDEDPDIRYVATHRLILDGSNDSKKVRGLLELSKDKHSYVRKEALEKLRYAPAAARPFIYEGVDDPDSGIRAAVAYALIYVPDKDLGMAIIKAPPRPPDEREIVVSLMIRLLKDDNVEVRKAASFCLFGYHFETEEALRVRQALEESPREMDQDARDLADRLKRAAEQQAR